MEKMKRLLFLVIISIMLSAYTQAENSKWQQLENIPDCRVWNDEPRLNESVTWTGICRNGHTEGEGELLWYVPKEGAHEKHIYVGHMVRGKLHGYGIYAWPDGSRYDGMWKEDNRHGKGVYTQPDGARYDGQWKNDYWHGMGTTFDTFGNKIYAGGWVDGQRSGYGVETVNCPQNMSDNFLSRIFQKLACGMTYDGNWQEDLPNGEGTMTTSYFGSYSGNWTKGCLKKFYFLKLTYGAKRETCK
jgi:hypothetical protein